MLNEKPWKLVDFLVVIALLAMLLVGGIFSNILAATRTGAPADTDSQIVNFSVSPGS